MSDKAEKINRLFELFGAGGADSGSFPELCTAITFRKNKENALKFSQVDFSKRLILLPQCIRSTEKCKAEEKAAEYLCKKCGACKAADIISKAEELGYMGVKILKGGSAVARLIKELKPEAVIGVACSFEGALGMLECERSGIVVQFVSLLRDGCSDTDVNLVDVYETMEFARP